MSSLLQQSSLADLLQGFKEDADSYRCLGCGLRVEKGVIYPIDASLFDARRYLQHHLQSQHGSPFDILIRLDKSATGLSDIQRNLIDRTYRGNTDDQLRQALGVGSTSTIRNHRFSLREKERQARVFLAIMALLADRPATDSKLQKYLPDGVHLTRMPLREKDRRLVLAQVAELFETGKTYTEKQVNAILEETWHDHVSLRRYLVSYRLLQRHDDGSQYWRPAQAEAAPLDRKTALKRQARTLPTVAGVYQIRNQQTGQVLIGSSANLKVLNRYQFQLEAGTHPNQGLQQDWQQYGKEAFSFDILETVPDTEPDVSDALTRMLERWTAKLAPSY